MNPKIVTITCCQEELAPESVNHNLVILLTEVIALTMVMITLAMADIIALIPRPIAEKIEPCEMQW